MPTRRVELLLLDTIENLGIVGDVVKVKPGFARNYLLPAQLAEAPSAERIEELKEARAQAQAKLAALRSAREGLLKRVDSVEIEIERSCNDQGILYGSVTQRDISDALQADGYDVGVRSVRLAQPIRRVGSYPVPIQFDKDLRTEMTIVVKPDRSLEEEMNEMEFDDEGNLIEPERKPKAKASEDTAEEKPEAAVAAE